MKEEAFQPRKYEEDCETAKSVIIEFTTELNLRINPTLTYVGVVESYMINGFFYMRFDDGCETYINTDGIKNILIDAKKPKEDYIEACFMGSGDSVY